jgi:hypothetical protein
MPFAICHLPFFKQSNPATPAQSNPAILKLMERMALILGLLTAWTQAGFEARAVFIVIAA